MSPHTAVIVAAVLAVVAGGVAVVEKQYPLALLCGAVLFVCIAIGGHL